MSQGATYMSEKIVTEFASGSNPVDPRIIKLLTKKNYQKLCRNGKNSGADHIPVVKLFMPDGAGTWLISELSENNNNYAFGLCDLGLGFPELGSVYLPELLDIKGALGLSVERDRYIKLELPLSAYYRASSCGYIETAPNVVEKFVKTDTA
jgi:hypothetical protein